MKHMTMRYKGFTFPVNPKAVEIKMAKSIATAKVPFSKAKAQEICDMPCSISAEGSFFGSNAQEQALRLTALFEQKGSAYLFAPTLPAFKMYFQSLSISSDAQGNGLNYTVTFLQDTTAKKPVYDFGFTLARAGENLFDIANRTGVAPEKIVAANHYETMFSVQEGDRVWLR